MYIDSASHIGWCNQKLEKRQTEATGIGLFATAPIAAGEVLGVWGGYVLSSEERNAAPEAIQNYTLQIDSAFHLTSGGLQNDADYFNHSCNPNAGMRGQIVLIAMRDIVAGEEVCFDYAMTEADPDFVMDCACGQPTCRHEVRGTDWQQPDLQVRYKGFFSAYIQSLIDDRRLA
jgi:hypothetical protein